MDALGLDLLRQLLHYEPGKRISARRALEHPYFAGMSPRSPQSMGPAAAAATAHPVPESHEATSPAAAVTPPGVRAVRLSDVCRSHSDPGLHKGHERMSRAPAASGASLPGSDAGEEEQLHRQRGRRQDRRQPCQSAGRCGCCSLTSQLVSLAEMHWKARTQTSIPVAGI